MFITEAYAQAAPGAGGGSFLVQMLPFAMILLIMYFLILRPQQKRMKDHREMIASIKRNDTVVTSGGLIGKVIRIISDDELLVELAEGVRVRVVRSTITEVRTRGDVREVESRKARTKSDDDDADSDNDNSADETQNGASKEKSGA